MDIKQKVAVVTGCSKGIGYAVAIDLLNKGARVAGWSRSKPDIQHPNFRFYETDLKSFNSVESSYKNTIKDFESVDILVNNAGLGYEGAIDTMPVAQWEEMFQVNVNGLFYCTRLVVPAMKKKFSGHIINLASIAATNGVEGMSGYCGTKHAVRGISQSIYKELRVFGIKVTCIYPGSVKTNFFDKIDSVTTNDNMLMPEEISSTIMHVLESPENCHHIDIEIRPLMPKGRPKK